MYRYLDVEQPTEVDESASLSDRRRVLSVVFRQESGCDSNESTSIRFASSCNKDLTKPETERQESSKIIDMVETKVLCKHSSRLEEVPVSLSRRGLAEDDFNSVSTASYVAPPSFRRHENHYPAAVPGAFQVAPTNGRHEPHNSNSPIPRSTTSATNDDVLVNAELVSSSRQQGLTVDTSAFFTVEASPLDNDDTLTFTTIVWKSRRIQIGLCLGSIGLILVSVFLTMIVTNRLNDTGSVPTEPLTAAPSLAPTSVVDQLLQDAVLGKLPISSKKALEDDEKSPQFRAVQWLQSVSRDNYTPNQYLQCYSMATFYYSTQGGSWEDSQGWLVFEDECSWKGATCDDSGKLTSLRLGANNLGGSIPVDLSLLTGLKILTLHENTLFGKIPDEFWTELTNLEQLSLGSNRLIGTIATEVGLFSELIVLGLEENELSSTIPSEIGELSLLSMMYLNNNSLQGSIPTQIGQMSSLLSFSGEANSLVGTIPTEVGMLSYLVEFTMNDNFLTGAIPTELTNLGNSLQVLKLERNDLVGTIPPLTNMLELNVFNIGNNTITGPIPVDFIRTSPELYFLSMYGNNIVGRIPTELGLLTNLYHLYLDDNLFVGTIPSEIGLLTSLHNFWVNGNQLSGDIPDEVCFLTNSVFFFYGCNEGINCSSCFPGYYS